MKESVMNVEFKDNNQVSISFGEKNQVSKKDEFIQSFQKDIVAKGYVVGNDIHRQDVGEFVYYQFYYFDGTTSRNIWFQIPKTDLPPIRVMDQIIFDFEKEKENAKPEIIFDNKPAIY